MIQRQIAIIEEKNNKKAKSNLNKFLIDSVRSSKVFERPHQNLEDGLPGYFLISGIPCMMQATFLGGILDCKISTYYSNQQFRHEINQNSRTAFGTQCIPSNMQRLYLAMRKRKHAADIVSTFERGRNETASTFLLNIKGNANYWTSVEVDCADEAVRITYRINDVTGVVIVEKSEVRDYIMGKHRLRDDDLDFCLSDMHIKEFI